MIEIPTFAANQKLGIMYSSEDLERFYFQYQSEALPHGESLQSFCLKNSISHEEETKAGDGPKPVSKSDDENPVRIWIDIRINNGLHLSQKNLSYQDLVRMIEKLEGLC